jgi:hypothetical protein
MKDYYTPEFEVVKYRASDAVVCSNGNNNNNGDDGGIGKDENEIIDD